MTHAERLILWAASAGLLIRDGDGAQICGLPGGARQRANALVLQGLACVGWIDSSPVAAQTLVPTIEGSAVAEAAAKALGSETRQLLRRIDEAGELVPARRYFSECDPVDEWVSPHRGRPGKRLPGDRWPALPGPTRICSELELQQLERRGLVAIAGGRATLTGAGRWCAGYEARRGPQGAEPGQGAESSLGVETAADGQQGPSKGAS
jgi:hypothetical protein